MTSHYSFLREQVSGLNRNGRCPIRVFIQAFVTL